MAEAEQSLSDFLRIANRVGAQGRGKAYLCVVDDLRVDGKNAGEARGFRHFFGPALLEGLADYLSACFQLPLEVCIPF